MNDKTLGEGLSGNQKITVSPSIMRNILINHKDLSYCKFTIEEAGIPNLTKSSNLASQIRGQSDMI